MIFMSVSADIKAVPRPFNTIVYDNGQDDHKRYIIRQCASSKYIPDGNP